MQKDSSELKTSRIGMRQPNVIWITLDSVRADHTTLDGYERDTTPKLAAVARRGVGFKNCISHGRSTLPSSGTILTGLAPSRTTVGITGDVLPKGVRTIAERFIDAGYVTAALSGNSFVGEDTELNRGFQRYQWLTSQTLPELGPRILLAYLRNIRKHSAGMTLDASKHSTPFLMNAVAKKWIRKLAADERPFFYYLHYNEPHRPYYPPLSYRDRFTDEIEKSGEQAAETAMRVHRNLNEIIADGADLSTGEWEAIKAMYDAEIAYTDHMIGRLIRWLRDRELEDTVVVITADHGELFGEYGLLSHKFVLQDALTRVPLVVSGLETPLEVGSEDLVQHVDVIRTLLELAGADTDGILGYDLRTENRQYAISQRGPPDFEQITSYNESYDASRFHDGLLTALRTKDWKYQNSEGSSDLYALPDEFEDVQSEHPDVRERLDEWLSSWLDKNGQPVSGGREKNFSADTKRQLKELGYID